MSSISGFTSILSQILFNAALLAGVPLLAATVVGVGIGLLQAVTQLQEQTLPQALKLFVVSFVLLIFGVALSAPLVATTTIIFDTFFRYGST